MMLSKAYKPDILVRHSSISRDFEYIVCLYSLRSEIESCFRRLNSVFVGILLAQTEGVDGLTVAMSQNLMRCLLLCANDSVLSIEQTVNRWICFSG